MIDIYTTNMQTNQFEKTDKLERGAWISLVSPTEDEIQYVCKNLKIEQEFIKYPLDYEEQARIDIDEDHDMILFVIDVPETDRNKNEKVYNTMPLGMIVVRDDFFITVSLRKNKIIEDFEKGKIKSFYTYKKTRFLLQILFQNSSYYLTLLKKINRETEIAEFVLQKSMKNKELIKLLNLEKSLVYFATSLKANELVMEKTLRGKIIKLYEEDEDILEDAIVENKQAIEMSKIYTDILNGTMDAYASIISNNLNGVMKFLTSVTIVLSLPTMVASFWGMNVELPFSNHPYGFLILIILSILISMFASWWLRRRDMF